MPLISLVDNSRGVGQSSIWPSPFYQPPTLAHLAIALAQLASRLDERHYATFCQRTITEKNETILLMNSLRYFAPSISCSSV